MDRKSLGPYLENLKKNNSLARDKGGYVPTFLIIADFTFNIGMFGESFVPELDKIEPIVLDDKNKINCLILSPFSQISHTNGKGFINFKIMTLQHIDHFIIQNLLKKIH